MERLLPWIRESREQWKSGGPRRHFGIRDVGTHQLIGNAEANLQLKGSTAGEVNISYAVFPKWRGQGIAKRAVLLICEWLSADPHYTKAHSRRARERIFSRRAQSGRLYRSWPPHVARQ
jgi:RimJ/RimL family protein N-acetyltransferase